MDDIFPEPIRKLPEADIPLNGIKAYLSQSEHHQLLFMQFENDVDLPEHSHAAQIGFVLEGKIDLITEGEKRSYTKVIGIIFRWVLSTPRKFMQDMRILPFSTRHLVIRQRNKINAQFITTCFRLY